MATCACDLGYAPGDTDPTACVDVDECVLAHGGCDPLTTCTNLPGSRVCGACPAGYGGSGETGCVPNPCSGAPDATCACLKLTLEGDDVLAAASGGVLPFATIGAVLDYAAAHPNGPREICVAEGSACAMHATYAGPSGSDLAMRDGVSVYGNYESTTWSRCTESGTELAPGTANGVYFGPTIASATVLDGFVIQGFAAEVTAGITLDGAHGAVVSDVELRTAASGVTTIYGIDAKNDADAALSHVLMRPITSYSPANQVGIRAIGARVAVSDSRIELLSSHYNGGQSVTGLWLEESAGSSLVDSAVVLNSSVPTVGIHAANATDLTLDGTTLSVGSDSFTFPPSVTTAVELVGSSGSSWQGGAVELPRAPYLSCAISLDGSPGAALDVDVSLGTSDYGSGFCLTGDATGTVLDGSVSGTGTTSGAGVSIGGCAGASPLIRTAVSVRAGLLGGEGIAVGGDCAPTITASANVNLYSTTTSPNSAQSLVAIHCRAPSRCTIDHSSAGVTGGQTPYLSMIQAYGIACDSGACPTVVDSTGTGLSEVGEHRVAHYTGGGISAPGATLVARNVARGLCTGGDGVGLRASGRIENNLIYGPVCGVANLDGVSNAVGLAVVPPAVVHSNAIDAGGGNDCATFCDLQHQYLTMGVTGGDRLLNNRIFSPGGASIFVYGDVPVFAGLLHNDLLPSPLVVSGFSLKAPTATITTIAGVNSLPGASGNFSGGSDIDAGTTLDAPLTDILGVPRDESPDVGPYEATGTPSSCFGVGCSNHGVCRAGACQCDPAYFGADCELPNECATDNGGCDPLTTCTGFPGGHTCGPCPAGFTGDGATGCLDIDECATNQGGCVAPFECVNHPGSFACVCPPGYVVTAGECVDVDECLTNNGGCDPLTACTNFPGGRTCGACPAGYTGDGATGCLDIDECLTNGGGCTAPAVCVNQPGSSTCVCPDGYTGTPETGCVSTNECLTDNGGCDPLTTCTDTPGGRDCGACPAGYYGTGVTGCSATCPCEHGGTCTTSEGEYACVCQPTFAGSRCEIAFTSVATGETHACGVRSDGQVVCWGWNDSGDTNPPAGTFGAVAAGLYHTCGIHADSGAIECWGQTGLSPDGAFTALAATRFTDAAIAVDGTLRGWASSGAMPAPPAGTFKQLAGTMVGFCAIGADDQITCFNGFSGAAAPPAGAAVSVGDGLAGSCAVMAGGALECWSNGFGNPSPPAGTFKAVTVGFSGACAIRADDTLVCFGGDDSVANVPAGTFKSVSVGYAYACAIGTDERLVCWGTDQGGFGVLTLPY